MNTTNKIVITFLLLSTLCIRSEIIKDISNLASCQIQKIYYPHSIEELAFIIRNTTCPIAVAGGRFSQGGHIWHDQGVTIDTKNLNNIVAFNVARKTLTVQTGISWKEIQRFIDPYGLSVKVMQSYNDFSVGGSLSVNVHGRTINDGPLIESVESIKIMLADGTVRKASRKENYDLFKGAIGGYGALGIITEVTLKLTENEVIEKQEAVMSLKEYVMYFNQAIKNNPNVIFHNANLVIPRFDKVVAITWYKSDKDPLLEGLQGTIFGLEFWGFQLSRYIKSIQKLRMPLHILNTNEAIVTRNYEMSTSVATIEPISRAYSTTILQEYFVPIDCFIKFVHALRNTMIEDAINFLNISIRYVHKNNESIMAYAQNPESFSLVCYINMLNNQRAIQKAEMWTQKLIDQALKCKGTYYLPYQPYATIEQFKKAYPRYEELINLKKKYDPEVRFNNSFIQKYIMQ